MRELFAQANKWLGNHMFVVVLSALFSGFILLIPDTPYFRKSIILLFAYMSFVTGLGISFQGFLKVLKKPWISLWLLLLIHIITPFAAWLTGFIFFPDNLNMRMGFLISASIPIGVTSVIWTAINRGNVALSLVTISLDTLVVPVFLPLFYKVVAGQSLQIDYLNMALQLLWMVTIPSLLGMVINDLTKGRVTAFSESFGGVTSKLAFALVIVFNASVVAPQIQWSLALAKTLFVVFLVVAGGYLVGYLGSRVLKNPGRDTVIAMVYNVGMRNISFGLVLALNYFPPEAAIPVTFTMLYQSPVAALVPFFIPREREEEKELS